MLVHYYTLLWQQLSLKISCKDMDGGECVLKVWFAESIVLFWKVTPINSECASWRTSLILINNPWNIPPYMKLLIKMWTCILWLSRCSKRLYFVHTLSIPCPYHYLWCTEQLTAIKNIIQWELLNVLHWNKWHLISFYIVVMRSSERS